MTHPLRVAANCTTHPLHKAQNLTTHPLSAPAHRPAPPILFDQFLSVFISDKDPAKLYVHDITYQLTNHVNN